MKLVTELDAIPEKEKTNSPAPAEVKVEITEVLLSMHKGFIEDVKPTWEKWEKEAATTVNS